MIYYSVTVEKWIDDDDPLFEEPMTPNPMGIYPRFGSQETFYKWLLCDCETGCSECILIREGK